MAKVAPTKPVMSRSTRNKSSPVKETRPSRHAEAAKAKPSASVKEAAKKPAVMSTRAARSATVAPVTVKKAVASKPSKAPASKSSAAPASKKAGAASYLVKRLATDAKETRNTRSRSVAPSAVTKRAKSKK